MFKKAFIASAMLVSVIGANASETAAFGITGGSSPSTCSISLSANGAMDYGTKTRVEMNAVPLATSGDGRIFYNMGRKSTTITVACGAATSAKLSFTDNKAGKSMNFDGMYAYRFGVVDGAGTVSIGGIDMDFENTLIDGVAAAGYLHTANGTSTWGSSIFGWPTHRTAPGYTTGFIKTAGETTPSAFTNFTTTLMPNLYVLKSYIDSSPNAVLFSAGGVITLTYL